MPDGAASTAREVSEESLPRAARLAALVLAVALIALDFTSSKHVAVANLFSVPLLICGLGASRRWLAGILGLILVDQVLVRLMPALGTAPEDALDVATSVVELVAVAVIVHLWIGASAAQGRDRTSLERQNEELECVNEELREREEETVRQSEELQSQTEELERQSEELRLTNDELAERERTLEKLLELSRDLTTELDPSAVRQRICASLGLIIEDSASAVLERVGDEMSITCHDRFGADGPAEERLPFAPSFSALVLSAGQTIYIDDLDLRPDLKIPQPKRGARFRSALGTPIRIQGKVIGTLEAYLPTVGRWTDMQAGLLESLAAQTAISIRNAELFEKVQHERRRFESAFRTAPFGLAICDDPEGREFQLNQAAALPFGLPSGEPIETESPAGRRFSNSLHRGVRRLSDQELPQRLALSGVDVRGEEVEMRLPDGRTIALLASGSPIYDGKGRISGAIVAFADITRQKELQRELEARRREAEEATNRKTRFLAAVSHDIRTPANAINLMAEIIKRSASNPHLVDQIPELAQRLQTNAVALIELVSDVLDLARYDSGRIDVQESEFHLGELIAAEVEKLRPLSSAKSLAVSVEPPAAPIWLRTDAVKVSRILDNLLGNALKFTAAGEIAVASGIDDGGSAWFSVRDSGPGIHEQDFERIFDEFQQLKNPERDARKGTGLGLAICRRLVEVLGARIDVQSEVGRGSVFTVRFPASAASSGRSVSPQPAPSSGRAASKSVAGIRVLLVEDHDTTRLGTAHILATEGAIVTDVATGKAALSELQRDESDVLLLDMMLPDMDGREILGHLRAARPSRLKAILVLTGDTTADRRAEAQRLGADALLTKPIGVNKLLDVLELIRVKSSPRTS